MESSFNQPTQPEPTSRPLEFGQPVSPQDKPTKLGLIALILSLAALLASIAWPLSVALAITSIIMGGKALKKKYGHRGKSIASIVIGATALALAPFWFIVASLVLWLSTGDHNPVSRWYVNSTSIEESLPDKYKTKKSPLSASSSETTIETSCYTLSAPKNLIQDLDAADGSVCAVALAEYKGATGAARIIVHPSVATDFIQASDKQDFIK